MEEASAGAPPAEWFFLLGGVGQGRRVTLGHRYAAGVRGLGLRLLGEREGRLTADHRLCKRGTPVQKTNSAATSMTTKTASTRAIRLSQSVTVVRPR